MNTDRKPQKMLGAHVPRRPVSRRRRAQLYPTAREFATAFAGFVRQRGRTHLAYQRFDF